MRSFNIVSPSTLLDDQIQHKIDQKIKPLGALGDLERIAFRIARIQQTLMPSLVTPTIVVFAADHGIAKKGLVNPFPQEVTQQMVMNFLSGGAAISVLSKQNDIAVKVVDAGVNYDFGGISGLIDNKIGFGTKNYLEANAMSLSQCEKAIYKGAEFVADIAGSGCNVIGFGEMGIGNTSSAALIMSLITDLPLDQCVGKGTGADNEQMNLKFETLSKVLEKHADVEKTNPLDILCRVGGFEIAQMCGGMLKAAELGMIVLVDGFISTAAMLLAQLMNKGVLDYTIFTHCSEEKGHKKMLDFLKVKPILKLGLRLGEGTGCAIAYPIIQSACTFMRDMASFEEASVSQKS
ncbi:MAG: nicotinate-nucleotide--dimethylbenzimidazole phosphoribosyltransferase [Cyclobacteriaceae bacterium]